MKSVARERQSECMDLKNASEPQQEPAFVLLERVWYLPVVPMEPAGFANKGQDFLLTSVPLQERCCAPESLMQELIGFLVLFGIKLFLRSFIFAKKTLALSECALLDSSERRRMSFLPQQVSEQIPFPSHHRFFVVACPGCHTPLCCLS